MAWFEIIGNEIWSNEDIPTNSWNNGNHDRWGVYLGGRWCLDYTFKLMFGISTEDWKTKFMNIKTDDDFYAICDWLGVRYKKNGKLYNNN